MNMIRQYFLCITAAAMLYGLLSSLLSSDRMKRMLQFSGTLIVLLSVMTPVLEVNPDQIAKYFSKVVVASEESRTGLSLAGQDVQKSIIMQRCREYISDKLLDLDMTIEFSLTMNDDQGISYPYHIELRGSADDRKKEMLSAFLSADLGIPEERQVWVID